MKEVIFDLKSNAQKKGYITFDEIILLSEKKTLSLKDIDFITGLLMDEGFLVLEDQPAQETGEVIDDSSYDKSQLDYEKIYYEVIRITPQLSYYIDEIRKIPAPRKGEEAELIILAKEGNDYATKRLILMFLKIVIRIALSFHKRYMCPLEEAIQEGNIGLILAIEKFEVRQGNRFSTYAPWWIRQKINRYFANNSRIIRLPVHLQYQIDDVKRIKDSLFQESGTEPSLLKITIESDHLSNELKRKLLAANNDPRKLLSKEQAKLNQAISKTENLLVYSKPILSLDNNRKGKETSLADTIRDDKSQNLDQYVNQQMLSLLITNKFFKEITARDIKILKLRYSSIDDETVTLEEIGEMEGLTRERIRQIEVNALRKLRGYCLANGIRILDWVW